MVVNINSMPQIAPVPIRKRAQHLFGGLRIRIGPIVGLGFEHRLGLDTENGVLYIAGYDHTSGKTYKILVTGDSSVEVLSINSIFDVAVDPFDEHVPGQRGNGSSDSLRLGRHWRSRRPGGIHQFQIY